MPCTRFGVPGGTSPKATPSTASPCVGSAPRTTADSRPSDGCDTSHTPASIRRDSCSPPGAPGHPRPPTRTSPRVTFTQRAPAGTVAPSTADTVSRKVARGKPRAAVRNLNCVTCNG